jgi:hypothetical protein
LHCSCTYGAQVNALYPDIGIARVYVNANIRVAWRRYADVNIHAITRMYGGGY